MQGGPTDSKTIQGTKFNTLHNISTNKVKKYTLSNPERVAAK